MGLKPKVKRPPLFLFREIADAIGVETVKLRSMLQVAARQKRWVPPIAMQVGRATKTRSISQRRNYYRKDDFIKFLKQEKAIETTDTTKKDTDR
jgi:hypothetical protein